MKAKGHMIGTLAEVIVQCVEAGAKVLFTRLKDDPVLVFKLEYDGKRIDRFITFGSVEDSSIDIIAFELARSLEILKASEPAQTIDDTPR